MEINDDSFTAAVTVTSPDGRVRVLFAIDDRGVPRYAVYFGDSLVLAPSALGLSLSDDALGPLEITATARDERDETYPLLAGKSGMARNHYRELTITLRESGVANGRLLALVFRVFDDGVAFRYALPASAGQGDTVEITGEATEFCVASPCRSLSLRLQDFATSFEGEYTDEPLAAWQPGTMATVPLTLCGPEDAWFAAITEARLTGYAGMYLTPAGDGRTLRTLLAPLSDAGDAGVCVRATLPLVSPWRVILIGASPGALIESNVVLNLNDPVALADTSWIKPGKVLWDWWSGGIVTLDPPAGGMNTATMAHYIDFAAEWGLEYMLIDGG